MQQPSAGEAVASLSDKNDKNDRIIKLVNSSSVMLFMKGEPDAPKCGFSRKIVELLRSHNIKFSFYDILTDEIVRTGLKVIFDWPTFPQLYVHGALIGGLDILTEMAEDTSSPLKDQLGINDALEQDQRSDIVPNVDERLKELVNRAEVMLFMKGEPNAPRCGFSKMMVEILREESIQFDSFDILEDEVVRAELKRFSDWPTYPQLYVRGSLVGGLDIVKEMKEEGSLKEQLSIVASPVV